MAKEYLFISDTKIESEFDELFELSSIDNNIKYLVSNIESANSEIYAPEVNFYFNNSEDDISEKPINIKKLYDARSAIFDLAQDIKFTKDVGNKLLIVSNMEQDILVQKFTKNGFVVDFLDPFCIVRVDGSIGSLTVLTKNKGENRALETDQIVWFAAPRSVVGRSGMYDPQMFGLDVVIERVKANLGTYSFKNYVKYDKSICLYHKKRQEICGKCADVCPSFAIEKNRKDKTLQIADANCLGCGKCVSVCPSGALDYAPISKRSFRKIRSFYKEKVALVIPERIYLESLHVRLKENVLPFIVGNEDFLYETHLLSLLQTTGNPIIIYADNVSKVMENCIRIMNEIFKKIFNRQAIFVCQDEVQLNKAFTELSPLTECVYDLDESGLTKRQNFSARLAHLVGKNDFGILNTGPYIHYGNLSIDKDICTLCLSCADACDAGALKAHAEDNTLRFNPSYCTSCGYCERTCPEKNCLHIIHDQLSLLPEYFQQNVVAEDEIFKCAECGTGFAPAKSISKIADIMKPFFGDDTAKIRTLYCCPDCKAKVMLESLSIENLNK